MNANNLGEKITMNQEAMNRILKDIIKEDKIETLQSMVKNGFNIDNFIHNGFNGVNAIVSYKLDCEDYGESKVMDFILENYDCSNISEENIKRMQQVGYGTGDIIEGFFSFLDEKLDEFVSKNGNKSVKDLGFEEFLKFISDGTVLDILNNAFDEDGLKEENTENKPEIKKEQKAIKEEKQEIFLNIKNEDLNTSEKNTKFNIIGDSNYKVASISSYVTLENMETCETENITIQASSIEELSSQINNKIDELNSTNDEKLMKSLMEMMNSNSEFKNNIIKMMKDTQVKPN